MKRLLLSILFFVTFFNVKSQDLINMSPTGFVNDYEQIFSVDQRQELEKILSDYSKATTVEICVATSADYPADVLSATDLFNKWGIGKKQFNNGILILIRKNLEDNHGKSAVIPGYGVEEFLPDATLEPFKNKMIGYFKTGDYYGGVKSLVLDIQKKLGNQGVEYLRDQEKLSELKKTQAFHDALYTLLYVFLLLLILGGIGWVIFIQYQKNKKFLVLKKEIQMVLNSIDDLKRQLGNKIDPDVQNYVGANTIDLTNKLVTEETRSRMQLVYNKLLENKQVVNSIDNAIVTISKTKSDIQKYLSDNYPYCEAYLKDQLNNIITEIQPDQFSKVEYTKKTANKLTGVQSLIDGKLRTFLALTVKINNIVSDYKNLENKNTELKNLYSEYIRKKNILSSVKIGKRYSALVSFEPTEFNNLLDKLKNYISHSMFTLNNGDLNSAISNYGNFVTTGIVITSSFSSTDTLFNDYKNGEKFIRDNQNKPDSLKSSIDYKINKSGVSYTRKTTYESIKSDLIKYKSNLGVDIILAAGLLKTCISDLETLLSKINSDISEEEYSVRRKAEAASAALAAASYSSNNSYSSSSSSDNSFGGFSGGGSGGGGVSGDW